MCVWLDSLYVRKKCISSFCYNSRWRKLVSFLQSKIYIRIPGKLEKRKLGQTCLASLGYHVKTVWIRKMCHSSYKLLGYDDSLLLQLKIYICFPGNLEKTLRAEQLGLSKFWRWDCLDKKMMFFLLLLQVTLRWRLLFLALEDLDSSSR